MRVPYYSVYVPETVTMLIPTPYFEVHVLTVATTNNYVGGLQRETQNGDCSTSGSRDIH